jgi:hypothetical protein
MATLINSAALTVATLTIRNAEALLTENHIAVTRDMTDAQIIERAKSLLTPTNVGGNAFVAAAKSENAIRGNNPHSLNSPRLLAALGCSDATELKELIDGCVATIKGATAVKATAISLNASTEAKAKKNAAAAGVNWKDVAAFKLHLSISIPLPNKADGEFLVFDYKSETLLSDSIESLIEVTGAEVGQTCKITTGDVIGQVGERQTVWIKSYTAV